MGARSGYSILNATVVSLLCFSGSIPTVLRINAAAIVVSAGFVGLTALLTLLGLATGIK